MQEYFAFPERFCFFEVGGRDGLKRAFKHGTETQLDLILLLNQAELRLENNIDASNFKLFCASGDQPSGQRRPHPHQRQDVRISCDRGSDAAAGFRDIQRAKGGGHRASGTNRSRSSRRFTGARDAEDGGAYFTVNRVPRVASVKEQQFHERTRYPGSEVYLSLVDAKNMPFKTELKQLAVAVYCTNRDLALTVPIGKDKYGFHDGSGAHRNIGDSLGGGSADAPRPSHAEGDMAWRIISHLTLNYLSLTDLAADPTGASKEQVGGGAVRSAAAVCRAAGITRGGRGGGRGNCGAFGGTQAGGGGEEHIDACGDPPDQQARADFVRAGAGSDIDAR